MVWCKVTLIGPGSRATDMWEKLPCDTQSQAKKMLEAKYPGCKVHAFPYFANGNNPPSFWPK